MRSESWLRDGCCAGRRADRHLRPLLRPERGRRWRPALPPQPRSIPNGPRRILLEGHGRHGVLQQYRQLAGPRISSSATIAAFAPGRADDPKSGIVSQQNSLPTAVRAHYTRRIRIGGLVEPNSLAKQSDGHGIVYDGVPATTASAAAWVKRGATIRPKPADGGCT